MSKWGIFLNESKYCSSQRGTGCRPCDMGAPCDRCHYDSTLQKQFKKVENTIDESLYCSICNHKLRENETKICAECKEFKEEDY